MRLFRSPACQGATRTFRPARPIIHRGNAIDTHTAQPALAGEPHKKLAGQCRRANVPCGRCAKKCGTEAKRFIPYPHSWHVLAKEVQQHDGSIGVRGENRKRKKLEMGKALISSPYYFQSSLEYLKKTLLLSAS